jgi:hypothetical protein
MVDPMNPMVNVIIAPLEQEDEDEDENEYEQDDDEVPMAVLALPERMARGGGRPLSHEVQEPRISVNLRATDPACQVLPLGSPFEAAYDFYALDMSPSEFVQHVPERYRAVLRSGASLTAYDARQLLEAVKGDVHNRGLPLADRRYALDTDRGRCTLTRHQYADLWDRASGQARNANPVLAAVETTPLADLLQSLSDSTIAGRILSDGDARRTLAWRVAGAHAYPSAMDFIEPGLENAVRMMLGAISTFNDGNADSGPDAERDYIVARAELMLAVALRNPFKLDEISPLFPEEEAGNESLYALESLLKAHDVLPEEVSSWDAEEGAIMLLDAFRLADMDAYVEALEMAARAGAQRFAEHIIEDHLHGELDCDVAADLASLARRKGHDRLAAYFDECPDFD